MSFARKFTDDVAALIKACRNLRIVRKTRLNTGDGSVVVAGDRSQFPSRLWDVSIALDAFADDEAVKDHLMIPDIAIEALLEWLKENEIDDTEPRAIIAFCKTGEMPVTPGNVTPDICHEALLRLIRKGEERAKELGPVSPSRKFVVKRNESPSESTQSTKRRSQNIR